MNDVATLAVEAANWVKKLTDAIAAGDAALAKIATPAFRTKKIWQTRGSQTAVAEDLRKYMDLSKWR